MKTTNYAIVTVMNRPKDRGWGSRHYAVVQDYEYLEDARDEFKYGAVELYAIAREIMNRYKPNDEPDLINYHLEIVKLSWEGNNATVTKTYTDWPN